MKAPPVTRRGVQLREHPAKFSEPIVDQLDRWVLRHYRGPFARGNAWPPGRPMTVFDPFAGVGRIHQLHREGAIHTNGMEIEPEWAAYHDQTWVGDSVDYMAKTHLRFDVVATSPCYGNRLSDHHEAKDGSTRRSYRHDLGRMPHEDSSATIPWGARYWEFHANAYRGIHRILLPGGLLLLNVSNFISGKREVHAVDWHRGACWGVGLVEAGLPIRVETSRLRHGENHAARVDHEVILRFRRPDDA